MSSLDPAPNAPTRRSFFGVLIGSISAAVAVLMAVPLVRFVLDPVIHPSGGVDWFDLGPADQFKPGEPVRAEVSFRKVDGWRATQVKQTVWVTHDAQGQIRVLSGVCPHLGCVALWHSDQKTFICPCHKGTFAADGARISGPPPRGLDPLPVRIDSGKVLVKYQYFRQLVPDRQVVA